MLSLTKLVVIVGVSLESLIVCPPGGGHDMLLPHKDTQKPLAITDGSSSVRGPRGWVRNGTSHSAQTSFTTTDTVLRSKGGGKRVRESMSSEAHTSGLTRSPFRPGVCGSGRSPDLNPFGQYRPDKNGHPGPFGKSYLGLRPPDVLGRHSGLDSSSDSLCVQKETHDSTYPHFCPLRGRSYVCSGRV